MSVSVNTWHEKSGFIDDIITAVFFYYRSYQQADGRLGFFNNQHVIFLNVLQKRKALGIIKSMGASNRFVVGIYIFEAAIYSVLSFTLGFF